MLLKYSVIKVLPINYFLFQLLIIRFCFIMQHCIVLDIEGTTTPISFVTDVLFPYARDNVVRHLTATYDTSETQADIKLLRSQVSLLGYDILYIVLF